MYWLNIVIFINFVQTSHSINGIFIRKASSNTSKSFKNKNESLAKLFRIITKEYLKNCTLGIIYDLNYEQNHPIDFKLYFGNTFLPLIQEAVNFSTSKISTQRYSDKCTNYVIFLRSIFTLKHIMPPDIKSKMVIVSDETPWEIKDFLKSHISRLYKHLLIITHSVSRRHCVSKELIYMYTLFIT
jgi:hypothetical protein